MASPKLRLDWLIALAGIGSIAVFGFLMDQVGPFRYYCVCEQCGAVQLTTAWQVPHKDITLFTHSATHKTPVSLTLTTNGIVPPHLHQWMFGQGGGNGVRCALGRASQVRSGVESAQLARLIAALHVFGERAFRDKVVTNLFDPETTHLARTLPVLAPTNAFTDASAMHAWIVEHTPYFDESIALFKKR